MLAAAWEELCFCRWPRNRLLGVLFLFFLSVCLYFFRCVSGIATTKSHPWDILTGNSLCQYKSLAIFVIIRNGKLSEEAAPYLQMHAPMLSQAGVMRIQYRGAIRSPFQDGERFRELLFCELQLQAVPGLF